ncbi:protein phosphatase CheZ [Parashewanella spongiae]|uniref:Protein phosphatase CheZ n=1 Tax=Parashewanella spongiae TaxID=342950 RepID=A0A3A6U2I2_9GAMM|nr:protein phosphatase CheZ [Parashewanella spongiae]MCL1077662.1 protein phosphatase CheZ [Parashewanella spongiae]RJY18252.1 protein phosphatase CheZ [Parashewanella spongiae]
MHAQHTGLINLTQAQNLVELLSAGEQSQADALLNELVTPIKSEMYEEIGKLTRQLHSALTDFQIDSRIVKLANTDIPDAKERLNYVIDMTEQAANKTMDAVEESLPLANALITTIQDVQPSWDKLMRRDIDLSNFKSLCYDIQNMMERSGNDSIRLRDLLNQILMAQDFQDLTGQMIRRVIELVHEVESSLVSMLTLFGENNTDDNILHSTNDIAAEGPILNAEQREDVVAGQDEVDDLLSSLGF